MSVDRPDGVKAREEESVDRIDVWTYGREGLAEVRSQPVVHETPVTLYLNGREVVTLLCAGRHLDELAAGFFHGEGFLRSLEDLDRMVVDEAAGKVEVFAKERGDLVERLWEKRTVTSGCGKGSIFHFALDALVARSVTGNVSLSAEQVLARVEDLNRLSETYRMTHGVHNTALATPGEILLFRDDIGRHNAVDMIVGHVFLRRLSLDDKILITTGRLTSEMILKAGRIGVPVVVSRNAATSLAVELARRLDITLIGYARGGRFQLYNGRERIAD